MLQRQGRRIPKERVARIQRLLAETDMTIKEIVESAGCSRAAILRINQKFGIRRYTGRSHWLVDHNWRTNSSGKTETAMRDSAERRLKEAS
jgi:DNA-binding MurR/RpiR family transcriptional regulator